MGSAEICTKSTLPELLGWSNCSRNCTLPLKKGGSTWLFYPAPLFLSLSICIRVDQDFQIWLVRHLVRTNQHPCHTERKLVVLCQSCVLLDPYARGVIGRRTFGELGKVRALALLYIRCVDPLGCKPTSFHQMPTFDIFSTLPSLYQ